MLMKQENGFTHGANEDRLDYQPLEAQVPVLGGKPRGRALTAGSRTGLALEAVVWFSLGVSVFLFCFSKLTALTLML